MENALHWQILIACRAVLAGSFLTDYVQSIDRNSLYKARNDNCALNWDFDYHWDRQYRPNRNIGVGSRTAYYISEVFAIVVGLALVNAIRPGDGADLGLQQTENLEESVSKFGETRDAVQRYF